MFKLGSEKTGKIAEKAKNQSEKISETARKQTEKIAGKLEEQIAALKALVVITKLDATDENAAAEHLKEVNIDVMLVTFLTYSYKHH